MRHHGLRLPDVDHHHDRDHRVEALSRYPDVNKGFVSPRTGRLLLPFATGDDLARGTRM